MRKSKAAKPRRKHAPQFKAEVVQLVDSGAKTVGEVSRDFGLADSLVRTWINGSGAAGDKPVALTASEKEELLHLRREVKVLRVEREILKRAATFFAKESA